MEARAPFGGGFHGTAAPILPFSIFLCIPGPFGLDMEARPEIKAWALVLALAY